MRLILENKIDDNLGDLIKGHQSLDTEFFRSFQK
jgi:hypothetical protein